MLGTYEVKSSCLTFSGDMDTMPGSLECRWMPVVGTLEVTGTWIAKSNGSYDDKTTTKGKISFSLTPECLKVSRADVKCVDMGYAFTTLGWKSVVCAEKNGLCDCAGTTELKGGLGTASPFASETGDYETSGSTLSLDKAVEFSYCVDGDKLTLTPKPSILPLKGTIVLTKTGGTGGTGGSKGGSSGSAGGTSTSSGGKGGSAGAKTGGSTSSGGQGGGGNKTGGSTGGQAGNGGTATGGAATGGSKTGGTTGTGGTGGSTSSGTPPAGERPCDIYAAAGLKCATAHSTVRALYASYSGKLYRVKRDSDKSFKDIGLLEPGGVADAAAQDEFCANTKCTLTRVYDQSGNGNYVEAQTQDAEDESVRPKAGNNDMQAPSATSESLTVGGQKVYSLYLKQRNALWRNGSKSGMPLGKAPQGIYMVTSGKHFGDGCCFNYGNGPLSRTVTACGTIDAVNFSSNKIWDYGSGNGPWVMADFECGLVAGGKGKVPTMNQAYVVAIEKNKGTGDYVLRGGDATTGKLQTTLTAKLPFNMNKEGAVNLGSGGDCCYSNWTMSQGTFYEGAIVDGYPSDEVEDKVHANIISAGYKEQ